MWLGWRRELVGITLALVCASSTMTACEDDGQDVGFGGPDGMAAPASGVWNYRDGGVQSNSCGDGLDLTRDPDTRFQLTYDGAGTFTVDQGQAGPDFDCTIGDDNLFECPSRLFGEEDVPELDATLTWNVRIDGAFVSDLEMEGTQTVDITCAGTGCSLAPAAGVNLPCQYTVAFRADK